MYNLLNQLTFLHHLFSLCYPFSHLRSLKLVDINNNTSKHVFTAFNPFLGAVLDDLKVFPQCVSARRLKTKEFKEMPTDSTVFERRSLLQQKRLDIDPCDVSQTDPKFSFSRNYNLTFLFSVLQRQAKCF